MPPQSRGARPRLSSYSRSEPNVPTLKSLTPLDTSFVSSPSSATPAAANGAATQAAARNTTPERFPDLEDSQDNSSNAEELSETAPSPQSRQRSRLTFINGASDSEEVEEEESQEEEIVEEDEESGSEVSESDDGQYGALLDPSSASEDDDNDDDGVSDDRSSDEETSSSHPSTLRPPGSTSLPSSTTTSPQKRPTPNRTHSLYSQPANLTKSQPNKLPGTGPTLNHSYTSPTRTTSHRDIPAAFAPPFYNRPPTPLPPSPSLTSLLRPPFSALPSRPATPGTRTPIDSSSDTDATHSTTHTNVTGTGPSAAASTTSLNITAANAPIQPPSAPKIPTYEYYGFVLYITSSFSFFLYLLWSYLPTPFLHALGIYYYPNRWWSLAVPAWLVVLLVWVYIALSAYNTGTLTEKVGALGNLVDEKGAIAVVGGNWGRRRGRRWLVKGRGRERVGGQSRGHKREGSRGKKKRRRERKVRDGDDDGYGAVIGDVQVDWKGIWDEGTDAVLDVPIGGVCEVLYGAERERESEEGEEGVGDADGDVWKRRKGGRDEDGLDERSWQ